MGVYARSGRIAHMWEARPNGRASCREKSPRSGSGGRASRARLTGESQGEPHADLALLGAAIDLGSDGHVIER